MFRGTRTFPRLQARQLFSAALAARRSAAVKARNLARFRVVTARRHALGLPATRGFRPLGLRSTGEKKVIDVAVANYSVDTTGSITLLNGCTQGSDYDERVGRKIVNRSVYIRGYVTPTLTANVTSPPQLCRMILFIDNQPNGAAPAVTDVLNTANSTSQLNLNNRDRFKILRDETFPLGFVLGNAGGDITAGDMTVADCNVYKKLAVETIFNAGNAGTIGDINSGAIYMMWIGSQVAGPGNGAVATVSARIRFMDP